MNGDRARSCGAAGRVAPVLGSGGMRYRAYCSRCPFTYVTVTRTMARAMLNLHRYNAHARLKGSS